MIDNLVDNFQGASINHVVTGTAAPMYSPYGNGYTITTSKQKPYIRLNFVGNGDLAIELEALKRLVEQLEDEIESRFGCQCSSDFSSYSRSFKSPDRSEDYSFGA